VELEALLVWNSHGFDDSKDTNADGNLVDWGSRDLKQFFFSALTGALAAQYSTLEPLPGTFVDGRVL
jgi:predicted metalloendopeptidase